MLLIWLKRITRSPPDIVPSSSKVGLPVVELK
jgi:hypothetical protein